MTIDGFCLNKANYIKINIGHSLIIIRSIALRTLDIWFDKTLTTEQYKKAQGLPNNCNVNNNISVDIISFKNGKVFIKDHIQFLGLLNKYNMLTLTPIARAKARERAKNFKEIKSHI